MMTEGSESVPAEDRTVESDETAAYVDAQARMRRLDNYYRWILNNFGDCFGRRIWDASAGVGVVTSSLVYQADLLLATEHTTSHVRALHERFSSHSHVVVEQCDLTAARAADYREHRLDTVVNLDVLEHLEDDLAALRLFYEVLEPGGRLLLKVPAHPWLFGSIDEVSLHCRRYAKNELRRKLQSTGFTIERLRFMNMAAVVPYFYRSRVVRRRSTFSGTIRTKRFDAFNRLMPWLERIERFVPPPFGLSLIAIGRRDG